MNKFEETLRQIEQADTVAVKNTKERRISGRCIDCSSSDLYWYGCYCGCKRVL